VGVLGVCVCVLVGGFLLPNKYGLRVGVAGGRVFFLDPGKTCGSYQ
jgi:formylmethanofuran:tetrahydromethanopterin formyltransferase